MFTVLKTVRIYVDVQDDTKLIVDPEEVTIYTSQGDEVEWDCVQGDALIEFKGDTPFRNKKFNAPYGGGVRSGKSEKSKVRMDPYKYCVEVTIPASGPKPARKIKKDPGVIVEE